MNRLTGWMAVLQTDQAVDLAQMRPAPRISGSGPVIAHRPDVERSHPIDSLSTAIDPVLPGSIRHHGGNGNGQ